MTAPHITPVTEPERFTQVRHRCPFCRRSWTSAARARKHVAACWLNPAVRGCKTCRHAEDDAGYIDGCGAGVSLLDKEVPYGYRLHTMCPLWELRTENPQ